MYPRLLAGDASALRENAIIIVLTYLFLGFFSPIVRHSLQKC